MLRAASLALSSLIVAQAPDEMVLCTTASDCPAGASCEDGVCVIADSEAPPPIIEERPRRERKRRGRKELLAPRDPYLCRRGDCVAGQQCYRGACGPPVPSTGTGLLIAGGVVTGVSLIFFAGAAVCQIDDSRPEREQNVCTAVQASIGAVALAVGVPMLVIGIYRRWAFDAWVRTYHPQLAVTPIEGGARASLGFAF